MIPRLFIKKYFLIFLMAAGCMGSNTAIAVDFQYTNDFEFSESDGRNELLRQSRELFLSMNGSRDVDEVLSHLLCDERAILSAAMFQSDGWGFVCYVKAISKPERDWQYHIAPLFRRLNSGLESDQFEIIDILTGFSSPERWGELWRLKENYSAVQAITMDAANNYALTQLSSHSTMTEMVGHVSHQLADNHNIDFVQVLNQSDLIQQSMFVLFRAKEFLGFHLSQQSRIFDILGVQQEFLPFAPGGNLISPKTKAHNLRQFVKVESYPELLNRLIARSQRLMGQGDPRSTAVLQQLDAFMMASYTAGTLFVLNSIRGARGR